MKLTITEFFTGFLSLALFTGCGSFSADQTLSVEMYGVSKSPESATGDRDPKFQVYQLLKLELVSEDGSEPTTLFDNESEEIFRIVDREQLIFTKKIDDLEGSSFSNMQLTFLADVTGGESSDDELGFTMSTPTLSLGQAFAVEKAKNLTLMIKINWGNTLADGTMTEPAYVLSLE